MEGTELLSVMSLLRQKEARAATRDPIAFPQRYQSDFETIARGRAATVMPSFPREVTNRICIVQSFSWERFIFRSRVLILPNGVLLFIMPRHFRCRKSGFSVIQKLIQKVRFQEFSRLFLRITKKPRSSRKNI